MSEASAEYPDGALLPFEKSPSTTRSSDCPADSDFNIETA